MLRVERNESFMIKITSKDKGTQAGYKVALNNFENFCMEEYGKVEMISEIKECDNEQLYDFLQAWINWNSKLSPRTTVNMFSRINNTSITEESDYPQDIKE